MEFSLGLGGSKGDSGWITALVELGSGYDKVQGMAEPNQGSKCSAYQSDDILQPLPSSGKLSI